MVERRGERSSSWELRVAGYMEIVQRIFTAALEARVARAAPLERTAFMVMG